MGGCQSSNPKTGICHASKLKPTPSFYYGKAITIDELSTLRSDFWSTRIDGNSNVWQALKSAAEALLNNDIELSRAILDASEISINNNTLGTCYDPRYRYLHSISIIIIILISGHMYIVPNYCTKNPQDIQHNSGNNNNSNKKAISIPGKPLKLKIRVCDLNISLDTLSSCSVQELKELIADKAFEISNSGHNNVPNCLVKRQRIMLMGQELKDDLLLQDLKVDDSKIVQVFLRPE